MRGNTWASQVPPPKKKEVIAYPKNNKFEQFLNDFYAQGHVLFFLQIVSTKCPIRKGPLAVVCCTNLLKVILLCRVKKK